MVDEAYLSCDTAPSRGGGYWFSPLTQNLGPNENTVNFGVQVQVTWPFAHVPVCAWDRGVGEDKDRKSVV